jgi:hypothetical protein
MQARNLLPEAAAPELDDDDDDDGLLELEDDPQAAASRAITANPAAIRIRALKMYLLCPATRRCRFVRRLDRWPRPAWGREIRSDPPGMPEG